MDQKYGLNGNKIYRFGLGLAGLSFHRLKTLELLACSQFVQESVDRPILDKQSALEESEPRELFYRKGIGLAMEELKRQ